MNIDDIKQVDIKVFAKDGGDVTCTEFMGILQGWIRDHSIPGVLIDVADYCHMHHGPGMVLIAHEFNISIDYAEGRMGLLFHYKLPPEETFAERLQSALRQTFNACRLLEQTESLKERLTFDASGFRFMTSDRLNAPNDDTTYAALAEHVQGGAKAFYGADVTIERVQNDSRERLAIQVAAKAPVELGSLASV